jgi:Fe-S cluster biogenesis protein NfuA
MLKTLILKLLLGGGCGGCGGALVGTHE